MPKITIRRDGELIREVSLSKTRTTLGRRPYNDVVLKDLAVSGRHACLIQEDQQVTIEDLGSTNGTYVNGRAVKKQILKDSDTIEIDHFQITFSTEPRPLVGQQGSANDVNWPQAFDNLPAAPAGLQGRIKVISGPAAGRDMPLTKTVTTFGKPGLAVAAITKREANYYVHHVEGTKQPLLNATVVGQEPVLLRQGDQITLGGTVLQFFFA